MAILPLPLPFRYISAPLLPMNRISAFVVSITLSIAVLYVSTTVFKDGKVAIAKRLTLLFGDGGFDEPNARKIHDFFRFRDPNTGEVPRNIRKKELAFAASLPRRIESRSIQWQNRGPYNLGGRTRAMALD